MYLSDLITPTTSAGTALFLEWDGYHVFSIPKRELLYSPERIRFSGVGGKRRNPQESFADCALREGVEEIGQVISHLESAEKTNFLKANGTLEQIDLIGESIRPWLVLEKRKHSKYGSMTGSDESYYLVAFKAVLSGKPKPCQEIAAILYLKDQHLFSLRSQCEATISDLLDSGAQVELQTDLSIDRSTILVPHGTAYFLVTQ